MTGEEAVTEALDSTVADQLRNAIENDADFSTFEPEDIAADLMTYSADFDGSSPTFDVNDEAQVAALVAACRRWKISNGGFAVSPESV